MAMNNKHVTVKSFFNWSNEKKKYFVDFFTSLSDEEYEFVQCISVKRGKIKMNNTYFSNDKDKMLRFKSFIDNLTMQQKEFVCVFAILSPLAKGQAGVKRG